MPSRIDSYDFMGTLGTGATGTVRLARQPDLDRYVAIKEFAPSLVADPYFLQRFRAEAQIMARLDNPHCVKVYDFIEEPGRAWLVSEYVEGASLRKVLDRAGFLTPEQALGVLKGALIGLGYGHSMGLVHRDVKPDNLIADREGVSKLADFGQALFTPGPGAAGGIPAGTAAYMSPEQVNGTRVDYRSDIYAAGAMLFEFLTGKPPFRADSPLAMMRMHISEPVPDPRAVNSALPQGVAEMVMRALAKDPADRQQTAFQFLSELELAAAAGYGEDWEKRSSIKGLVAAVLASSAVLLVGEGAALAAGGDTGVGILAAAGMATRTKWLIAGGGIGVLVLAAGALAFGAGVFAGHHRAPVAIARSTPSPTPGVTPSPETTPSPSATAAPSPSPVSAGQPLTVSGLSVWFEFCSSSRTPQACDPLQDGSQYTAGHPYPSDTLLNCGQRSMDYIKYFEQYGYSYPQPTGNPAPISVSAKWTGLLPNGSVDGPTNSSTQALRPGSGTMAAASAPGYADMNTRKQVHGGTGYVQFELTWTNPDGTTGHQASKPFYYQCSSSGG